MSTKELKLPEEQIKKVRDRVARAHGQIGGVLRLIDEAAPCDKIVTQIMATSKALDKAAATLLLCGFDNCPGPDEDGKVSEERALLEKLLLSMA